MRNYLKLKDAKSLAAITEENTLFLSICSNAKIPYVKDVMEWFKNSTIIDMGDCEIEGLITRGVSPIIENREYQKELVRFLNAIDINIVDIEVEKINIEGEKNKYRIYSYHKAIDSNELVAIPFYEESSGTQKCLRYTVCLDIQLKLGCLYLLMN